MKKMSMIIISSSSSSMNKSQELTVFHGIPEIDFRYEIRPEK